MPLLKQMMKSLRDAWRLWLLLAVLGLLLIPTVLAREADRKHQARVAEVSAALSAPVSEFALQDADRRTTREARTRSNIEGKLDALRSTPDDGLVPWYLGTLSELRSDAQDARGYGPGPSDRKPPPSVPTP